MHIPKIGIFTSFLTRFQRAFSPILMSLGLE